MSKIVIKVKMSKKIIKIILIIFLAIVLESTSVLAENEIGEAEITSDSGNASTGEVGGNTSEESSSSSSGSNTSNEETQTLATTTQTPAPTTEVTNTTPTKTQETSAPTTTNKNTTTTQTTAKSSNANLSNLGITPNDFSGFTENKTTYNVSVPNTVKSVQIYATAKDSKSSISGIGKLELKEGENTAEVTVVAEDGTTKIYTINIKRLKQGETLEKNNSSTEIYLKKLEIESLNLEPSFDVDKYQYMVNYEGDATSLLVTAEANLSSAIIQIIGNENLTDGQNIVTIIVSDSSEESSAIYQIYVNKNLEAQKELQRQIKESEREFEIKMWIVRILIIVIVVGIIALLVLWYKRSKEKEEYLEDEENIPKSFKKQKNENKEKQQKKVRKGKGKHGK